MHTFDATKLGTVEKDVTYCTVDGNDLKMDVYYPPAGGTEPSGPWPVLVWVHGGGWAAGDKTAVPGNLTEAGYLVTSMDYRMCPAYRFPAMIEDVKCAIRYLRAHAAQYNLDPAAIGLAGHSAGGHLVALAGLAGESAGWDVGPYLDQSSRVQAVVTLAGPSDLTQPYPEGVQDILTQVFGPEQWAGGSPVTYAHAGAPPFLIVHGDQDGVVPVEQAHRLHQALREAGASSELVIVQHAGHGFEPAGGTPTPSMDEITGMTLAFVSQMTEASAKR